MADDKSEAHEASAEEINGSPVVVKQGFLARTKAHFKKWWWVHLIIFVIVVLVVALPVVYVAYPKIAQSDVNKSTLNTTGLVFSDPTPNSIHINQTQVLTNHAIYHPTIYGFNATITLVGSTAALVTVPVPRIEANNGEIIDVDATVSLNTSNDAVTNFTIAVLGTEEFELNIYGRPGLKEGALPKETVTFNKTVTMAGLNGLKGFALEDIKISLINTSEGTNMNGTVFIPNPSVITVSMGNVTLDVSVNGSQIGQSYLDNFVLVPGNNSLPLTSAINNTQVLELVLGNSSAYPSGVIPLTIVGNSSVYNGQEIPYYTAALQSTTLETTMNVTEVLINSGLGDLAGVL